MIRRASLYIPLILLLVILYLFPPASNDNVVITVLARALDWIGYSKHLAQRVYVLFVSGLPRDSFGAISLFGIVFIYLLNVGIFEKKLRFRYSLATLFLFPLLNFGLEPTWLRRLVFFFVFLPIAVRGYLNVSSAISSLRIDTAFARLLGAANVVFWLIFIIPGFYFPPFFDGIAGWSLSINDPTSYKISGIRIHYADGSKSWFRPSFFNPLTQRGRPQTLISRRDKIFYNGDGFSCFLFDLYKSAWPALSAGRLPTEKILGGLSYKPHTLDKFDYRERYFPPDSIIGFSEIRITKGTERHKEILAKWPLHRERCS